MRTISIALCTCNGARFLPAQLASLQGQEGVAEIVAVDDGSDDGTVALLLAAARRDPRIRVYRNAVRLGVTANFQRAIGLAQCAWVALADQDDVWAPGKLACLRRQWDGRACLMHHATRKFSGARPTAWPAGPAGERRKFSGGDPRRLFYRNTVVGHTTLMRTEAAHRLMPYPAGVAHDWWLGVGAAALGGVQYVDEFLVHYRIHEHNCYHARGTRLRRLRGEHEMRLRLLGAAAGCAELGAEARRFADDYRARLQPAETGLFSWRLWRFYRRHGDVLFGGAAAGLTPLRLWRKSLCATLGAAGRSGGPAAGPATLAPGWTGGKAA